jgi:hypothetical protein
MQFRNTFDWMFAFSEQFHNSVDWMFPISELVLHKRPDFFKLKDMFRSLFDPSERIKEHFGTVF